MSSAWDLPGPQRFLDNIEQSLRRGASVVVRFPGRVVQGFDDAIYERCDFARWTSLVADGLHTPRESLAARFAPESSSLAALCSSEQFCGRLVYVSGFHPDNWIIWSDFLATYAQLSRNVADLARTRFLISLTGVPLPEPPQADVTIESADWRGVVTEIDLLILAYSSTESRTVGLTKRTLLATTVARVAAWDLDVAEMLLTRDDETIFEPSAALRAFALDRGWGPETPAAWELGTASADGSLHAGLASLTEPRLIERRIWSAQTSVLLPLLDSRRYELIRENYGGLNAHLRSEGTPRDPFDLDFAPLEGFAQRPGFSPQVTSRARELNKARRKLAHLEPLPLEMLRSVVGP